jgi:hypothetical protein
LKLTATLLRTKRQTCAKSNRPLLKLTALAIRVRRRCNLTTQITTQIKRSAAATYTSNYSQRLLSP